jgi:hypothetical protein
VDQTVVDRANTLRLPAQAVDRRQKTKSFTRAHRDDDFITRKPVEKSDAALIASVRQRAPAVGSVVVDRPKKTFSTAAKNLP